MFFHTFNYSIKRLVRQKSQIFWCLCFPIILGTLFYFAFGKLDSSEELEPIPVAVVVADHSAAETDGFCDTINALSEENEDQFLQSVYTTESTAMELLEKKEIVGILYYDDRVSVTVSSDMVSSKLEQSILQAFVQQFNLNLETIKDVATDHPENLVAVIEELSREADFNREITYSKGSLEQKLTYFFNLISMICLFSSMSGCVFVMEAQANMSPLGARRCLSPIPKMPSLLGDLLANVLVQFSCVFISLLYYIYVLHINFGSEFGYVVLACFVGCLTGVSMGIFAGCFGKSVDTKIGILIALSMLFCFLSGLMIGSMRILVAQVAPWFNHINPAALIADSFYSLTVYQSHARYFQNIGTLLVISAVFCLIGLLFIRREKYASL